MMAHLDACIKIYQIRVLGFGFRVWYLGIIFFGIILRV